MAQPVLLGPQVNAGPPVHLLDRYTAVADAQGRPRRLGAGGFGEVYLYRDDNTQELVAIKITRLAGISPHMAQQLDRFLPRELGCHYRLRHPCVVDMKNVFLQGTSLYIVLEYVSGGTLLQQVNALAVRPRGLTEDQARFFFQQIVVTLHYLHSRDVVHRDIKLENALVEPQPEPIQGEPLRPRVKVADFGLSRFGEVAATNVGTAEYKAPEILALPDDQQQQDEVYIAPQADCWSAGAMLYAMLALRYPFASIPNQLTGRARFLRMTQAEIVNEIDGLDVTQPCKELLRSMLEFVPTQRITIQGVMAHPWFQTGLSQQLLQVTQQNIQDGLQSPCEAVVPQEELQAILNNVHEQLLPLVNMHHH